MLIAIGFAVQAFRVLRRLNVRPRWFLAWPLMMSAAAIVDAMLRYVDSNAWAGDVAAGHAVLASIFLLMTADACTDEPSTIPCGLPACRLVRRDRRRRHRPLMFVG